MVGPHQIIPRFKSENVLCQLLTPDSGTEPLVHMNIFAVAAIGFSLKLVLTVTLYRKNKMAFKRLSLPAKGAVIGGGWLASYGIFQFIEGII